MINTDRHSANNKLSDSKELNSFQTVIHNLYKTRIYAQRIELTSVQDQIR